MGQGFGFCVGAGVGTGVDGAGIGVAGCSDGGDPGTVLAAGDVASGVGVSVAIDPDGSSVGAA